jgi:hypothetical protein
LRNMSHRPRLQRIKELEAENKLLRKRLSLGEKTYESAGAQEFRDVMAAEALSAEWGNEERALRRLGFEPENYSRDDRQQLCERIFQNPGTRSAVDRILASVVDDKGEILERLRRTALHGSDDAAVRAFDFLARIAGWYHGQSEQHTDAPLAFTELLQNVATQNDAEAAIAEDERLESARQYVPPPCFQTDTLPWDE